MHHLHNNVSSLFFVIVIFLLIFYPVVSLNCKISVEFLQETLSSI